MLDLTSTYGKLDRAEVHLKAVHGEIHAWTQSDTRTFTHERNRDFTRYGLIAQMSGPKPDFLKWTLMIGDCIVNLRSALDHLIYAIAKHETINDPTAKIESLAFIICDEEPEFTERSRTRLKYLSAGVLSAIKSVQPFARNPYPEIRPLLAILRDFANDDKHRLLKLANAAITKWDIQLSGPPSIERRILFNPGEIEHDSVFCVVESSKPDPDLHVAWGQVQMVVALWHGFRKGDNTPMTDRSDFASLLDAMAQETRFVVELVKSAVV